MCVALAGEEGLSEQLTTYDATRTCSVCGDEAQDLHHPEPRGRSGGKQAAEALAEPIRVCRRCHNRLEPEGSWSLKREGEFYIVRNVPTGELVSRRPIEPRADKGLVALNMALDLLDPRDEARHFITLLSMATDDELLATDAHLGQMGGQIRYGRMLLRHEMWLRNPGKEELCDCKERRWPQAVHDVAEKCDLAEYTVWEDVRAAQLYIADDGKPMPDSFYRIATHAEDQFAALGRAREIFEAGGTTRNLRAELGLAREAQTCTCIKCGNVHLVKQP